MGGSKKDLPQLGNGYGRLDKYPTRNIDHLDKLG